VQTVTRRGPGTQVELVVVQQPPVVLVPAAHAEFVGEASAPIRVDIADRHDVNILKAPE
jgi:hypothetical protein